MLLSRRAIQRYGSALLALLVAGWLLLAGTGTTTSALAAAALSRFTSISNFGPVGVAATPGRVLVVHCDPAQGHPVVLSVDPAGNVTVLATIFVGVDAVCIDTSENYITIAPAISNPQDKGAYPGGIPTFPPPNPAGFTSNVAYVTNSHTIYQVQPNGSVAIFAQVPSCPAFGGITFDRVSTFSYQLIAVCTTGQVWVFNKNGATVKADGSPTALPIATVSVTTDTAAEGPDVAPLNTPLNAAVAGLGGQLFVAVAKSGGAGKIFSVNSVGVVTSVTALSSAESIAFIPSPKCTYGPANTSPVYFTAAFGGNALDSLSMGAFAGLNLGGNALIATEGNRITLLSVAKGKLATSTFVSSAVALQGSAFVDCSTPLLLQSFRNDFGINAGANGVVTVWILKTPAFDPLTICVDKNAVNGQSCSAVYPKGVISPPHYGVTGTESSFAGCGTGLVSTNQGPALQCKFTKSALGITSPISPYNGPLIINLFYVGGGGDGDAGGEN